MGNSVFRTIVLHFICANIVPNGSRFSPYERYKRISYTQKVAEPSIAQFVHSSYWTNKLNCLKIIFALKLNDELVELGKGLDVFLFSEVGKAIKLSKFESPVSVNSKCLCYISILESAGELLTTLELSQTVRWFKWVSNAPKYLLIIPGADFSHRILAKLAKYLEKSNFDNVSIVQIQMKKYVVRTYCPFCFDNGTSGFVVSCFWTIRKGVYPQRMGLFRRKQKLNFHGRLLRASIGGVEEPFTMYNSVNNRVVTFDDCIELRMLNIFSEVFNFKWEVTETADGHWGVDLLNGSFSGAVGALQRKEIEFGLSLNTIEARHNVIDFLERQHHNPLTFIVAFKPGPQEWMIVLRPFNLKTWLGILGTMLTVVLFIYLVTGAKADLLKSRKRSKPLNMADKQCKLFGHCKGGLLNKIKPNPHIRIHFALRFTMADMRSNTKQHLKVKTLDPTSTKYTERYREPDRRQCIEPNSRPQLYCLPLSQSLLQQMSPRMHDPHCRFILAAWLVFSILVATLYRSSLVSIIALGSSKEIYTLDEILQTDYVWGFKPGTSTRDVVRESQSELYRQIYLRSIEISKDSAYSKVRSGKFVYMDQKISAMYIISRNFTCRITSRPKMHVSSEYLYLNMDTSWGVRKEWPFKPSFDSIIRRLRYFGIIDKITSDLNYNVRFTANDENVKRTNNGWHKRIKCHTISWPAFCIEDLLSRKVSLAQLIGVLEVYYGSVGVSCLIFAIELTVDSIFSIQMKQLKRKD